MPKMTEPQYRRFLSEGARTGELAMVRADGRPHVIPIWYLLEGDELVFTTGRNSVKGKNLRRDRRVMICVVDETPPYALVAIEGVARLSEDPKELYDYTARVGGRYMGAGRADEFGRRNGAPGEMVVRVRLDKVIALDGLSD
jgi:PPOX class probable F420-dependent enzyme